jgi:hypothetical protein
VKTYGEESKESCQEDGKEEDREEGSKEESGKEESSEEEIRLLTAAAERPGRRHGLGGPGFVRC